MKFYLLGGLDSYASYMGITNADEHAISTQEAPNQKDISKWRIPLLTEYMGDPPRKKPLRKGHYHQSAWQNYFSEFSREALTNMLETNGVFRPVKIVEREEVFYRYWCTNVVDCLDFNRSLISNMHNRPDSIGVVKKPVFDETKWDGSDVFRIPRDLNHNVYCSERFVEECRKHKIKGITFGIGLFDPDPIEIR